MSHPTYAWMMNRQKINMRFSGWIDIMYHEMKLDRVSREILALLECFAMDDRKSIILLGNLIFVTVGCRPIHPHELAGHGIQSCAKIN